MVTNTIASIDRIKAELDEFRPIPQDVVSRVSQRLRLETNYHSNAIEGNSLTLAETRSLILHGLTAHGKPMRDHLDIEGHDAAVKAIEEAVRNRDALNGPFIRNLHRILLKEPYEADAVDTDGRQVKRTIAVGDYKKTPNNVRTTTGEIYHFGVTPLWWTVESECVPVIGPALGGLGGAAGSRGERSEPRGPAVRSAPRPRSSGPVLQGVQAASLRARASKATGDS